MARTTKNASAPENVASDTTPEEVAPQEVADSTDENTTENVASDEDTDTDTDEEKVDPIEEAKTTMAGLIDEVVASAATSDTGKPTDEALDPIGDAYLDLGSSRGAILRGLLNEAQARHTDDDGDPSLPFLVAKAKVRAEAKATSGRPAKEAGPSIGDVAPARVLWALEEVHSLVNVDGVTIPDDLRATIKEARDRALDAFESVDTDDLWAEGKVGGKERSLTGSPTTRGGGSSPKRDESLIPDGTALVYRDEHKGTWKADGIVLPDGSGPHAPSTAANKADGSTVNGWTAWKVADEVGDYPAGTTIDKVARVKATDEDEGSDDTDATDEETTSDDE